MKTRKQYKPRHDSFPDRTIKMLFLYGELKNEKIRKGIGLNAHSRYSLYKDRSSYYFAYIVTRLMKKNVVQRTKTGYYDLTKEYRLSLNEYFNKIGE